MMNLKEMFQLPERGAKDLKKGIFACTLTNLSLMLSVAVTVQIFLEILKPLTGGEVSWSKMWILFGAGVVAVVVHFFCCKNWSAARNSFIYHGYYNYHHLLFGKAIDGNFFLAVPGTYSGKEQQMAVSFGFPVFKESKEKVPGSCRGYWCRVL